MSVILPSAFPVFGLPKPTGNYKIGSQYMHLKTNRNEDITVKEYTYSKGISSIFYEAKIKNSGHANFMDLSLIINIPQINEAGRIDPKRALKIIHKTLVSFF